MGGGMEGYAFGESCGVECRSSAPHGRTDGRHRHPPASPSYPISPHHSPPPYAMPSCRVVHSCLDGVDLHARVGQAELRAGQVREGVGRLPQVLPRFLGGMELGGGGVG